MQRNHTKQLARKIMSLLLAGVFFADTAIFAEAPILPDQRAPGNRQPLVQETANGIPLVNISAPSAGHKDRVKTIGRTTHHAVYGADAMCL